MYGEKWINANYKKDDINSFGVITGLKFLMHKGNYNLYETDNGTLVNVFSDQSTILKVLRENPYDLYAVGFLKPESRYANYTVEVDGKVISVSTVARVMPIMKGDEESPRMILVHSEHRLLPAII